MCHQILHLKCVLVDDAVGALRLEGAVHELHLRLRELRLLGHGLQPGRLVPATKTVYR